MSAPATTGRSRNGAATRLAQLLLTRLVLVVAGGLTSIIVARALGPDDRGSYWVIITIATTAMALGNLSVEQSQTALWAQDGNRSAVTANALWLGLAVGTAAAAGAFATVLLFGADMVPAPEWSSLLWGVAAVPLLVAVLYVNNVHVLHARTGVVNRGSLAGALVQCSLLATLGFLERLTVAWVVIIWAVSTAANLAVLLPSLPVCRPRDRRLLRSTLSRGLRQHPGSVCHFLLLRLDVLILNAMSTTAAVGVYSMAVTPAELLQTLTSAVVQVALPQQMQSNEETAAVYTARTIRITVVLSSLSIGLFCIAGPFLVVAAAGPAFAGCVAPMLILAPGVASAAAARPAAMYLLRLNLPLPTSMMYGAALLVNVALNFLLIPGMGVVGCALASTVAYTALAAAQIAWFVRSSGMRLRRLVPGSAEVCEIARRLRECLRVA